MNWKPTDIQHLKDNYGKRDLYLIAWDLRRTEKAVAKKWWELLQKNKSK